MRISRIVVASALVLAACGGDDDPVIDPAASTTTTLVEADEPGDLFEEVETDDSAVAVSDGSTGDGAVESSSSEPASTDPVTTGDVTDAPAPAGSTPDTPGTTPASGTTGGASGGGDTAGGATTTGGGTGTGDTTVDAGDDDLCARVDAVADAFDLVDDADSLGTVEDLRIAYRAVTEALGDVRDVAPADVVSDIDLITVGLELVISSDVDGDELTDEQNDILSGVELDDAGDRFETFAVDTCGTELFAV